MALCTTRLRIGGKLYLSVLGLHSELGHGYADAEQPIEQRFAEADLNRDGRLSRIEVDEKMPRLGARFAWLDENRDGFLSRAELQPAPRR